MAKINKKGKDKRIDHTAPRLAGGYGLAPSKQSAEELLRRSVLACMLWENNAYSDGHSVADIIAELIPQVAPEVVSKLAIEARQKQKLRHVPLFMIVEMAKHQNHRKLIRETINQVISRVDQITDLLALYWKDGRKPVPNQMKLGLADAFQKFNEYQFAKYDRDGAVKLRDALRVCHAKPQQGKEELFKKINERTLATPETWEVLLSSGADKKQSWEKLIDGNNLPSLAVLRNLSGIKSANVSESKIRKALASVNSGFLSPLNFLAAAKAAPEFMEEISQTMLKLYSKLPKLPGLSVIVIDVSGSMGTAISGKSAFTRLDAGMALAMLAREQCEFANIWATAGSDGDRKHATKRLPNLRGFALSTEISKSARSLGGGGIFTRQCLEYIAGKMDEQPDRIIVFSDSQDCDIGNKIPKPFGKKNYIVDVSCEKHGINYKGVWTAEISGWSENFINFIAAYEGLEAVEETQDDINSTTEVCQTNQPSL